MSEGWIGVDLDSTLAHYEGWVSAMHIGDPIPAMVARVQAWLEQGHEVRILTARVNDALPLEAVSTGYGIVHIRADFAIRDRIETWCRQHIGKTLLITNMKDYAMVELYDDRCVQVEANTGRLLGQSTRGL